MIIAALAILPAGIGLIALFVFLWRKRAQGADGGDAGWAWFDSSDNSSSDGGCDGGGSDCGGGTD